MNIPKLHSLLLSLLAATAGIQAQTTPAPVTLPEISITATGAVVTDYMFRGQRLSGAAFEPTIEMSAGKLTLGVWANFPFDGDKVPGSSDPEIDPYGSYTFTLSEQLSIVPGFTLYTYPNADKSAGFYKTTFEPNLALNYTVAGVKFTPKIYHDVVLDGTMYEISAFYALPLKDIGSELDFTGTFATYKFKDFVENSSPATKGWGDYWLIGVAMPFQIAPNQKLTLGVAYTEGSDAYTKVGTAPRSPNALAIGRTVGTVSYSFSF